jgi:hypothetical protein
MRITRDRSGERGYSLAETAVYVGLVGLFLLIIVGAALTISSVHRRSRTYLDVNSAAVSAFSRFSRDIRRATSIDAVESTLDSSSGKLVLNMRRDDGTNDVIAYYLSGEKVKIDQNGSYWGDITPESVAVSNLTFRRFIVSTTTAIRIEMTVAPDASSTVPALNFYGTYVLRGSYLE